MRNSLKSAFNCYLLRNDNQDLKLLSSCQLDWFYSLISILTVSL